MRYQQSVLGIRKPADRAEQVARRWRPALNAFFLRRLRDPVEAEDLTQEVLLRLLAQPGTCADNYVFQIAQNLLIDRARRLAVRDRYRLSTALEVERDQDPIDAHAIVVGHQELARVMAVIAGLPERTREIFILYRFEKMSQAAIGVTFGISASAVKQQVAKAMVALARGMEDER